MTSDFDLPSPSLLLTLVTIGILVATFFPRDVSPGTANLLDLGLQFWFVVVVFD